MGKLSGDDIKQMKLKLIQTEKDVKDKEQQLQSSCAQLKDFGDQVNNLITENKKLLKLQKEHGEKITHMNEDSVLRNEQHTVLESQLREELSHLQCTIEEL